MLLLAAADETQKHDVASVVAVIAVFVVMLAFFCGMIWLAFRSAKRLRAASIDDDEVTGE
jgi:F0F1-type ATP synthase membrane subunit b/b'